MTVTYDELVKISRNPNPKFYDLAGDAQALAPHMKRVGITTRLRKAAFLANCVQETDYLKTLEEYGNEAYFRSFLGNQWRYHGRGYLMNTWKSAYERLSDVLGVDLVRKPDRLANNKSLAARAAVWFWDTHNLNRFADDGKFLAVASSINRGEAVPTGPVNGYDVRLGLYRRALVVFDPDLRVDLAPPGFVGLAPRAGNYLDRHPTRYFWETPVEGLIRRIYREFGRDNLHISTYVEHPEGWGWDSTSFDVWGSKGRGDWLPEALGKRVWGFVWNDPNPPWIEWAIYHRKIYTRTSGYAPKPFGDGSVFTNHDDHSHFSFAGPRRRLY